MGLNTTGTANTNDYVVGRGILRAALIDDATGLPYGLRDVGNCPQFKLNITSEELKHQSSRSGLKVTDKRVIVSQEIAGSFQLDEINQQNFALFFTGVEASITNPAVAGVGGIADKQTLIASAEKGRWYVMRDEDTLVRPSFADGTGIVIYNETTMAALTLNTDYIFDAPAGLVFIKADAGGVTAGDSLSWYSAAQAGAPAKLQQMKALTGSQEDYYLEFVQVNPANGDEQRLFQLHSVSVSADGDMDMLSDTWTVLSFKFTAQANAVSGETLTITTYGAV